MFHPFQYQVIDTEFVFLLGILALSFISHRAVLFFVGWLEEKAEETSFTCQLNPDVITTSSEGYWALCISERRD